MNKSKLSALLSLVFVFLSGGVLGAFAYRLYSANPVESRVMPPQQRSPEEFKKWYVGTMTKEGKLDPQQVQQLNAIMDSTRQEFDKLNGKNKAERDTVNEERAKFEQARSAFEEKWRPEREAIHTHQVDQINAILRPDQQALYTAFRAERDRQRKLREQQHPKKQ